MNHFLKSILTLGVTSALGLSSVNAATYQIVDKGDIGSLKYTYTQQENNLGEAAIIGTNTYNFPVQYQYLDENDFLLIQAFASTRHELTYELNDLEDYNAMVAGNPTANDLSWVILYLKSKASTGLYQRVGETVALINLGGDTEEVTIFDETIAETGQLTRSTDDFINGITDQGWIYGNASAPYLPLNFVESDGDEVTHWVREFTTRGYYSPDKGQTIIPLLPSESTYGGESAIFDVSDSNIAVGYASTAVNQDAVDIIEDETGGCVDPTVLENLPFDVCVQRVIVGAYNTEAFKWQIDQNGEISSESLGHLVTPHPDYQGELVSVAQAVNIHGVAVGFATGWVDENETNPSEFERASLYAVVYKDGEVTDFTDDHSEYYDSRAYDINDNGIAVGHATTLANGTSRTKFYYVDTNITPMKMVLPKDFFTGSASTARAINEHGMVVGEGEVETHSDNTSTPRRKHGFLYDINTDTFTNLNAYLPCDSAYTIIEARDINERNEISATAIIKAPRRNSKGVLIEDENEDVIRAVTMVPITGEIEDCNRVVEELERKGAGFGYISLFFISLITFSRRFITKR